MNEKLYTEQETVSREKLKEISKFCNPYPDSFNSPQTLVRRR